jgi:hypothetical protein
VLGELAGLQLLPRRWLVVEGRIAGREAVRVDLPDLRPVPFGQRPHRYLLRGHGVSGLGSGGVRRLARADDRCAGVSVHAVGLADLDIDQARLDQGMAELLAGQRAGDAPGGETGRPR